MTRILLSFPDDHGLAELLAPRIGARIGKLDWHRFPDGESLITLDEGVVGAEVIILASLHDPDRLALPLRFAAETARELGARRVGLVAPYLGYMRQDKRFHPGESVTAPLFARFLQQSFDWLVTVDPHLHRITDLDQIYNIPVRAVSCALALAQWISTNVLDAVLIGPDAESAQWVGEIARLCNRPFQVLTKIRMGDLDVAVSLPDPGLVAAGTPVIVDDIASSGRTLVEALSHLARLNVGPVTCLLIHAVFASDAVEKMLAAGAARIVSTNSITHATNSIDLSDLIAGAVVQILTCPPVVPRS